MLGKPHGTADTREHCTASTLGLSLGTTQDLRGGRTRTAGWGDGWPQRARSILPGTLGSHCTSEPQCHGLLDLSNELDRLVKMSRHALTRT